MLDLYLIILCLWSKFKVINRRSRAIMHQSMSKLPSTWQSSGLRAYKRNTHTLRCHGGNANSISWVTKETFIWRVLAETRHTSQSNTAGRAGRAGWGHSYSRINVRGSHCAKSVLVFSQFQGDPRSGRERRAQAVFLSVSVFLSLLLLL